MTEETLSPRENANLTANALDGFSRRVVGSDEMSDHMRGGMSAIAHLLRNCNDLPPMQDINSAIVIIEAALKASCAPTD